MCADRSILNMDVVDREPKPDPVEASDFPTVDGDGSFDFPINAMTVDVEEYFQVSAFDTVLSRDDWDGVSSRLAYAIDKILTLFDASGTKATFFVLGWILDKHPDLIRRISEEGHEIASHSYEHSRVSSLSRSEFRSDVARTKSRLEDVTGALVRGYRAPSFSIGANTPWVYDELAGAGYSYSSSVFPIRHDHYGQPDAPRFAYRPTSSDILEIPMSTISALGRHFPCSGGGYFRLLPLKYSLWAIKRINTVDRRPAIFYFHPWEMDPDQPRQAGLSLKSRFRHYVNLSKFEKRLSTVLETFRWGRIDEVFLDNV